MNLRSADPRTLDLNLFQIFGKQNALLTAGDKTACNTMTIGWCQTGVVWGMPVCTVYVRPERYTYRFMEEQDYFTVSVLPADEKKTMALCGTGSGRDTDKIRDCGLTVRRGAGDAPFFDEAELVLVCRKLYAQDMDTACIAGTDSVAAFYTPKMGGLHRVYTGEIVEVYRR